ncbi:MAG TPA: tetratricopeptide repeat protein [Gemmatimonadales bacterium]
MTTRSWDELEALLGTALDLPAADRVRYLDTACAGRPGLRRELSELVAAHERATVLDRSAAALIEPALLDTPGTATGTAGHYRILERLGEGGMGIVYKARDLRLERTLALKFLPRHLSDDAEAMERLRVEAQAAAALDHPNICTIHEIGEADDGQLFIAMAYYGGETVKSRLTRGPVPTEEAIALTIQAARGLAKAHERGVVHRDIKPANLMVTSDGVLKILDFGIAKLPGVTLTTRGERPGTVAYMSPEQIFSEPLDGRTDVWSLGVVLYEMLTGERPFRGDHHFALMRSILEDAPALVRETRPALPEELDRVLARMLAKRPSERCTAEELVQDLESRGRARGRGDETLDVLGDHPEVLPGGERRRLAIMAATAAAVGHDDELFRRFHALADEIVRKHGGVTSGLVGETVMAFFGMPATHEDDPLRAVRAALELARRAESQPSIGVHIGSAEVKPDPEGREYEVGGPVPRLATRLSRLAPHGGIWVSPDCRRAIGRFVETEAAEPFAIARGDTPVTAYRVLGVGEARTRLEAAEQIGLTAFSGRHQEMVVLRRALGDAASGEGRFVTVIGEAGLGKSRLLLESSREIERMGLALLQGRCEPSEGGTSYLPFVEALRDWLAASDEGAPLTADVVAARLAELGSELVEFVPLYLHLLALQSPEHPVPRHLHGEHFRLAIQEALAAFVTLAARRRPTVLLLEDWHWADEGSHGVLQQVAELVTGFPLLVVVTCRPGRVRTWGNPGHHVTLTLDPLDSGSSGSMLRSILRVDSVPGQVVELIHGRTGGNPFFLEEITQTLLEEGALGTENGQAVLTGTLDPLRLPDTVQGVIRARIDRLDRATREVLRAASVVGREFTRGILERIVDGVRLPHALQVLKAAGVIQQVRVVPEPAYQFKHILTHEAAVASLLEDQRRELHGRVGEAIEAVYRGALDEQLGRLVEHFSRAERWDKAVHYAMRSAERANNLSQFSESLETLERVQSWLLRLPDDAARRTMLIDILFLQERLCETLGLRGRQQRIIDELVSLLEPSSEPDRLAEASLRQGDLSTLLRRFDHAEAALDRALRLRRELGDAIGQRNTLRSQGLLRWHQGRDAEALECIEAALAIDRERGDLEAQVGDLSNLGNVLKGMGRLDRAQATLEEALRLGEEVEKSGGGTPETDLTFKRAYILHNLANVHRELGDDATALEYLGRSRTMTSEKRLPMQLSYHFTSTAHIYLQLGRVEESLALYREAVELTRKAKFVPGLAQALRFLGEVLHGLGRAEEALPPLVEAAGLFAQLHDPATEALLWTGVATLREKRGELEAALAAWSKARTLYGRSEDRTRELEVLEGLARVARGYLPEPSLALGYYAEALDLATRLGDREAMGRTRNAMGIIEWERGRYDEARLQYEAGLGVFREMNDAPGSALMLASLGVTLDAMGRRVEARRCLEEACSIQHASGDQAAEARSLGALAEVLRGLGETKQAIRCGEASLRLRRIIGDRVGQGWALQRLALAHVADGAAERAHDCAVEAAQIAGETGERELAAASRDLPRAIGR